MNLVEILVSGEYRAMPLVHWNALEGPKPPADFICNGCTMSPDYVFGKRVWPACVIHDFHYNGTDLDRKIADNIFRRNLKMTLKFDGMPGFLARPVAYFYYRAVRRAGKSFYNGGGNPD